MAGWGESRLASQIANRINNNASINDDVKAIANRRMVSGNLQFSSGSVLIHSKERGTGFTANNHNLTNSQSINQQHPLLFRPPVQTSLVLRKKYQ